MRHAIVEQYESGTSETGVSRTFIEEETIDVHFLNKSGIGQTYKITLN